MSYSASRPSVADRRVDPAVPLRLAREVFREELRKPPIQLLPTGIEPLDRELGGGLLPASTAVLVAGTGRGKTAFALTLARNWASQGRSVLYLTTELSRWEVLARWIAPQADRPWRDIYLKSGFSDATYDEMDQIGDRLPDNLIVHPWNRDLDIEMLVATFADTIGRLDVLIVDQLADIARSVVTGTDRRTPTAHVSGILKSLAVEKQIKVLVVHQVARHVTSPARGQKAIGRDFESAPKDSGEIEYDAAEVLYLDSSTARDGKLASATVHIAKSRGAAGNIGIPLSWDGALGVFGSPSAVGKGPDPTHRDRVLSQLQKAGKHQGISPLKKHCHLGHTTLVQCLHELKAMGLVRDEGRKGWVAVTPASQRSTP